MKTFLPFAVALAFVSTLHAQFHAPDTEFHDCSQRTFPVEAARVLAWQRNGAAGANIAEVVYKVETTAGRETVWTLQWLDGAKKQVREKVVRYPESLLVAGPMFYRDVLKQIAADDWAIASAPPDNALAAFWQGAEQAGFSRLDALTAADKLLAEKPKMQRPADATRLAGILAHGALPSLSTTFTLDSVLLSRAAAWLALGEAASRETFDPAWSPLLFLAGREQAASALWTAAPAKSADKQKPVERLWDFLCRPHRASEAFLFAAVPENALFAMPVIAYAGNMDTNWAKLAVEIPGEIFDAAQLARMHEYKMGLSVRGGVAGGHFGSDAPGEFLEAWEAAMQTRTPAPLDESASRAVFAKAHAARPAAGDEEPLAALARLAPVLNAGLDQAGAPLAPTGHATARDLVGYGWEMAGRQFGAQHNFLRGRLGDPDSARALAAGALGALHGCDVHFSRADAKAAVPLKDFARLQFQSAILVHAALAKNLPAAWRATPDGYLRRVWLAGGAARDAVETMFQLQAADEVAKPLLERLLREGGANNCWQLVLREEGYQFPAALERLQMRESFARAVPWAITPQYDVAWAETGHGKDMLAYGRRLEQIGWESLTATRESQVFFAYLEGNALPAAKRFYDQIVPFVTETVGFSHTTMPQRFVLAWWENDDAGMQRALRDGATYSDTDLGTQTIYALHRGDPDAAEKLLEATIARYGDSKKGRAALRDYLPLIPALKDPQHADHAKALDSFPTFAVGVTQWVLLRQAKLTGEEAVRFLGGDKAPDFQKLLIAYLRGDKDAFEKVYATIAWKRFDGQPALAALLRNDLRGTPVKDDLPDLKPAGARPLPQLIADARRAKSAEATTAALDFSQYKTADEAWAAVEKLKQPPAGRPRSREEMLKNARTWLENQRVAAEAFAKAWPADARRWDAKLVALGARQQLAQIEGKAEPAPAGEIEEILRAPDATPAAKGEAAYFQLMQKAALVQPNAPHTFPPFHQAADEYLSNYGTHPRAAEVAGMQMQLLAMRDQPGAENILKKLAAHPNKEIAGQAQEAMAQRERLVKLRAEPIELKVPTTDGKEIDFAKLRGKVVLIDFWASWCGPCIAELPNVVKTYDALHEKGFEIVGVSLDQDRGAMDGALKKHKVAWPQHFDGTGWKNAIARQFGVTGIPSTWLFDKHGKLRETELRGEELQAAVEKLLRE